MITRSSSVQSLRPPDGRVHDGFRAHPAGAAAGAQRAGGVRAGDGDHLGCANRRCRAHRQGQRRRRDSEERADPRCAVIRWLPRQRRPAKGDRGSGSLEFAVLSLAFLLLVFMTVQAALYYHARNVVKAEAEGTARAVRAYPTNAQLADSVPSAQQVQTLARAAALDQWERLDNSGDTTSRP